MAEIVILDEAGVMFKHKTQEGWKYEGRMYYAKVCVRKLVCVMLIISHVMY